MDDVFRLILAQIRSKHETAGDFRAQIAANATGVRRIQALVARHGRETILATMEELLEYTERRARAEIARLAHGTYEAEGVVDNDGYTDEPVRLAGADRDRRRRRPLRHDGLRPAAAGAGQLDLRDDVLGLRVRAQVPDRPRPAGERRLLPARSASTLRRARVTNCTWPSPVVGGWETQTRLVEVMFRALLPAFPERLPAGTKGMMCQAGFGSLDVAAGSYTCFYDTFAGGYGGRYASDGPDAVQAHGQNTENAPIEETELNYPVTIDRLSLVEDSEGAGPVPRRARPAQGLPRSTAGDDVHDPRRPRPVRPVGCARRARAAASPSTC